MSRHPCRLLYEAYSNIALYVDTISKTQQEKITAAEDGARVNANAVDVDGEDDPYGHKYPDVAEYAHTA